MGRVDQADPQHPVRFARWHATLTRSLASVKGGLDASETMPFYLTTK